MLKQTIDALRKMADLTAGVCAQQCPVSATYRCCANMFCRGMEEFCAKMGVTFPRTGEPIYHMDACHQCNIPPEFRPFCTSHVCAALLAKNKRVKRVYDRLFAIIRQDPDLRGWLSYYNPDVVEEFMRDKRTVREIYLEEERSGARKRDNELALMDPDEAKP